MSQGIITRHSLSKEAKKFANGVLKELQSQGPACILDDFNRDGISGYAPNVVCTFVGRDIPSQIVIFAAHYDTVTKIKEDEFKNRGGNDNASGVSAIIAIARAIKQQRIRFRSTVRLILFSGEEQDSIGSKQYAANSQAKFEDIVLMVMIDMIAYHVPGTPMEMGVLDPTSGKGKNKGTVEASELVKEVGLLYGTPLTIGDHTICCSDQDSFHDQGYPATYIYEHTGNKIVDLEYHKVTDVVNRAGIDFTQMREVTKVMFATLLHTAGFV